MNSLVQKFLFFFFILLGNNALSAQIVGIQYDDVVYDDRVHAVKFHLTGLPLTQPIIRMDSTATLLLTFDDLNEQLRDLYYTIIHCDADWTPSDLTTMEYLDGFDEEIVENFELSVNTLTEFTSYGIQIPNERCNWTKSGNYILAVYENDGDKIPLLTRRFMVVDPSVRITPDMVRPANVQKIKTHQEFDFTLIYEQISVADAKKEIKATILQNGRWDNAILEMPPQFIFRDRAVYDYQDKIVFPAGKEFRYIDLRSFRFKSEGIAAIEEYQDIYEITLIPEPARTFRPYLFYRDLNGKFVVGSNDQGNPPDYGLVLFSIEKNMPFYDADVYLFGQLTDWKIQNKFKMGYSEKLGLYAVDVLLKQGYYNYSYAIVPKGTNEID
ncbi:MAG: DUF5103 domain-containing protein, partial [Bacteroidota bacterium]